MPARPALLILSISPITTDARVMKQVELFRTRYDLTTCGYGPPPEGVTRHIEIPRDARGWVDDKASVLTHRFERAYWNTQAVSYAHRMLAGEPFDAILADDLNTVPLALSLNPRRGVHADLHELAPREKENDTRWRLFVAPFMRWLCRTYLPRVASTTTVAEGIAAEYRKDYGIECAVVTNAAPFTDRQPRPTDDIIRLVHSGAAQRYRRLENFIEAMKGAPSHIHLDLIVTPNEPDYVADLKQRARGMKQLTFRDPVPYAHLIDGLAEYDVGVVFFPPTTFNLAHALPNKFFEAVQARLGLVIGPSPEMSSILKEYQLGAVTDDFDVASLRSAVHSLDPLTVDTWKQAAHRAAGDLSSERQVLTWERALERILGC